MKVHYIVEKGKKDICDDSILIDSCVINEGQGVIESETIQSLFVADGVGGNAGGKEASMYLLNTLTKRDFSSIDEFKNYIIKCNDDLIAYGNECKKNTMATTLTGIVKIVDTYYLVHIGNTRLYSGRGGFLKQLSEDQTTYKWLQRMGETEAALECNKNEIYACFGGGDSKLLKMMVVKEIFDGKLPAFLMMTSDGIHDYVTGEEMERYFEEYDVSDAIKNLVVAAEEKGSTDDKSIIVLRG